MQFLIGLTGFQDDLGDGEEGEEGDSVYGSSEEFYEGEEGEEGEEFGEGGEEGEEGEEGVEGGESAYDDDAEQAVKTEGGAVNKPSPPREEGCAARCQHLHASGRISRCRGKFSLSATRMMCWS
jgi:hypothetical protein